MNRKSQVRDAAVSKRQLEPVLQGETLSRQIIVICIQEQSERLMATIRSYVQRFGLADGSQTGTVAAEILQETVVEALAHADTFVPGRQPFVWLLGIALNMMRRRRVSQAKRSQRELSLSSLAAHAGMESESDLLEQLVAPGENSLEQEVEVRLQVAALLALVSPEDQQVISLALLEDFQRAGLARRLGLSPNTARMRLSRALDRLRVALSKQSISH